MSLNRLLIALVLVLGWANSADTFASNFEEVKTNALKGDATAQFDLAVMYYEGNGVSKDLLSAAKWYRAAAKHGSAEAQYNLGLMFSNGEGVRKDEDIAKDYFKKACEAKVQAACDALK